MWNSWNPNGYDWYQWFLFSCYFMTAIFSLLGNGFLLMVIFSSGKKVSNTFCYIASQCVSDGLTGIGYMLLWFVCSYDVVQSGQVGTKSCETITALKIAMFFISSYTMTVISMDRFLTLRSHDGTKRLRAKIFIPIIWILGILTASMFTINYPIAIFFTPNQLIGCRRSFLSGYKFFKGPSYILSTILTLLIPAIVTTVMYAFVVSKIRRNTVRGRMKSTSADKNLERKKKTTKMLIALVVAYFVLSVPVYIYGLSSIFFGKPSACNETTKRPSLYLFLYFMAVSSSWVNPFIFCYFNQQFSRAFKLYVKRIFCITDRPQDKKSKETTLATTDGFLSTGGNFMSSTNSGHQSNNSVSMIREESV